MASTQEFRRRIKSVNNTKQITKAMEMVASVKMQKAIKTITDARAYVQDSWNMLSKLAKLTLPENHPLLSPRQVNKTAIIFVTADRGLCGAYNADLFKKLTSFIRECTPSNSPSTMGRAASDPLLSKEGQGVVNNKAIKQLNNGTCDIIAIGKKGAEFIQQYKVGNLAASFDGFDNNIIFEDIIPISVMSNGEYLKGTYDRVVVIYSHFVSSLKQTPVVKQILPIDANHIDLPELWLDEDTSPQREMSPNLEYLFEPNADQILEKLLRRFIRLQVYGAVLEANASVQSAQMVAMKNATDNAGDLISELTLTYNTIRQNSITNEIAEICAGAEAMK